jgi:hypothetical protein
MTYANRLPRIGRLAAAGALVLWAGAAQALSITGLTVALGPSNTADSISNAGANRTQVASSAGLVGSAPGPVADVVGASVSFDARYAALIAADREAGAGTTTQNATAAWTITFTIDNPTGGLYQIDIDTSRVGVLALVTDSAGTGSASLGAVTATLDGLAAPGLGLAAVGPLAGGASATSPFSQNSSTLSIVDTALTRTVTLVFTWTGSASGSQDEAAVRLGLAGGLGSTTADDYAGSPAGDGHFVSVGVTLLSVPEPRSAAMLLVGLLAALALGRERR